MRYAHCAHSHQHQELLLHHKGEEGHPACLQDQKLGLHDGPVHVSSLCGSHKHQKSLQYLQVLQQLQVQYLGYYEDCEAKIGTK